MLENGKISSGQFKILVILFTIGDNILIIQSPPAIMAKQDAWISAVFGLLCGLLIVCLFDVLQKHYPRLTFVEMAEKILERWGGGTVSFLFLFYLLLLIPTQFWEMGNFMTLEILPNTPEKAVTITFLLVVLLAVHLGLENISRSAEICFPILFFLLFVLVLCLLPKIKIENIQPVLEEGFKPVFKASFTLIAFPYVELFVLLMIFPYVQERKIRKSILVGVLVGGGILIVITLVTILVLGYDMTARYIYPSYALAKKINIGNFVQRIEAVLAVIWIITIFFKTSLLVYSMTLGLAQLLKLKEYRLLLFPTGMILVVLTDIIAPNNAYYSSLAVFWPFFDFSFGLLLPLLLLTIGLLRKKFEKVKPKKT
ncbi:endospore germination permease [Fictibacillus sp. Mic-4]|uniref:GerAB/ArcD/ProY family transporter n=1 Tax=Fictibacillus sp. Mic-4 TaxID=3132826 RepID=UPI003CEA2F55